MNNGTHFGVALYISAFLSGSTALASEFEVLGIAKVGDGSNTAKLWKPIQDRVEKEKPKRADLMAKDITQVDWVIQLKPMHYLFGSLLGEKRVTRAMVMHLLPERSGDFQTRNGKVMFSFQVLQGYGEFDWFIVFDQSSDGSGTPPKTRVALFLSFVENILSKGGVPLSPSQHKALSKFMKSFENPELVARWKGVEKDPANLGGAGAFLKDVQDAAFRAKKHFQKENLIPFLTPAQCKLMKISTQPGPSVVSSEATASASSGSGPVTVSSVGPGEGTRVTITLGETDVAKAFEAVVANLNANFGTKLVVPVISKTLRTKRIKIENFVLDSPERTLKRLALLAGGKLEKRAGKQFVVPEK